MNHPLKLGFIGLGIMGAPMAGHLRKAGHELFVATRGKAPAELVAAGSTVCASAKAHGVQAGVHNGRPDVAQARVAMGFRFVTVGSDARLLAAGSQQILAAMRQA